MIVDLLPFAGDPGGVARKLAPYPRDTVIPAAGTWLGSLDAALVAQVMFRGSRNPYCGLPAKSIIDAGLYVGLSPDLTQSYWNPAIFLDPTYWAELHRRNTLQHYPVPVNLDSYRHEQPAQLPPLKITLPPGCLSQHSPS